MRKKILTVAVILMTLSLFGQKVSYKEIIICDSKTACQVNHAITSCYKVKTHPDSAWNSFPYPIEGFSFEPGRETKILVEETALAFPDLDSLMFSYKLVRIIEIQKTVLEDFRLLMNNKWKVLSLQNEQKDLPVRKTGTFLVFQPDSNMINGFAGCNNFSCSSLIDHGVITFGLLSSTKMSCPNDDIENKIFEGLKGKAAYYIRNGILFIVCENNMIIHLRPEKKIDSLVRELNKPITYSRGNYFSDLKDGHFSVVLDDLQGMKEKNFLCKVSKLTAAEIKIYKYKLVSTDKNSEISEVRVLKKPHKMKGYFYAVVLLKNGRKLNVTLRNAT